MKRVVITLAALSISASAFAIDYGAAVGIQTAHVEQNETGIVTASLDMHFDSGFVLGAGIGIQPSQGAETIEYYKETITNPDGSTTEINHPKIKDFVDVDNYYTLRAGYDIYFGKAILTPSIGYVTYSFDYERHNYIERKSTYIDGTYNSVSVGFDFAPYGRGGLVIGINYVPQEKTFKGIEVGHGLSLTTGFVF